MHGQKIKFFVLLTTIFCGGVKAVADTMSPNLSAPENTTSPNLSVPGDTTSPNLSVPGDITAEATSASGTQLFYNVNANDDQDHSPLVFCSVSSGSIFPLGSTIVDCVALDSSFNWSSSRFEVSVVDTLTPVLTLPENTMETIDTAGTEYTFTASVTDIVDSSPSMQCIPASGSWFAVGETNVICHATDYSGNQSNGEFLVTLLQAETTGSESIGSEGNASESNDTKSVQITWDAPLTREDGESISIDEIGGYRISLTGQSVGGESLIIIENPIVTNYSIENLADDSYLITVSAVDTSGLVSDPSNTLIVVVQ